MNRTQPKHPRILAIGPSTRGFGFAVLEGQKTLVDWGAKSVKGDKNSQCLMKVNEMIGHYQPEVMVLQDHSSEHSRRCSRIRELIQGIAALASSEGIKVALFSDKQIKRMLFAEGKGTKQDLAEILARRFPEELADRLSPKRRAWMSEDYRMCIFDAVALALMPRLLK
jgi:Holliday junction resolvasome RuvABC endonuclease subunit